MKYWKEIATAAVISASMLLALRWQSESSPEIQASRLSMNLLREEGARYDLLSKRLHELRLANYELRFGQAARLRLEVEEIKRGYYSTK